MGPKVVAAVVFLESGGRRAIITSAERLADAVAGVPGAGTSFVHADRVLPALPRQERYA
jgi:carbamate kinase